MTMSPPSLAFTFAWSGREIKSRKEEKKKNIANIFIVV